MCATTFSASSFKQEAEKQNNQAKTEAHQTLYQKECGLFPNTSGVDHIKSYEADMRSGHCDLSILLLGFPRIDKGCPPASSTLLMSVGHVPSSCCCYPQMNHSVPMTLWERGAIATSTSVNHICLLRTHVLSSSLPMKSLQAAPKGFVQWTFSLPGIWHWATASSGMYGYRWLFAIVSNKMKMIKPQTWCKMKNSIWTIVPNILIYCMHFCTFNLRYIWNKVNLRPLHCFF